MSKRTVRVPRSDPISQEAKCLQVIKKLQTEVMHVARSPQHIPDIMTWVRDKETTLDTVNRLVEGLEPQGSHWMQLVVDCKLLRKQLKGIKDRYMEERRSRTPLESTTYRSESPFSLSMAKRRLREVVVRRQEDLITGAFTDIVPTKEHIPKVEIAGSHLHDSDELFSTFTDPGKSIAPSDIPLNTDRTTISRSGLQTERRYEPEDDLRSQASSNSSRQSQYWEGKKWRKEWEKEAEVNMKLREKLEYAQKEAGKVMDLEREINRIREEKNRFETDFHRLKEKFANKKSNLKAKIASFQIEKQRFEHQIQSLESEKSTFQGQISSLKAENVKLTDELQRYDREMTYMRDVISGLEQQVAETNSQDERIRHLEMTVREQEEEKMRSGKEEGVTREKEKGREKTQGDEEHLIVLEGQVEAIQAELRSLLDYNATLQDRELRLTHDLKVSEKDRSSLQTALSSAQYRIVELEKDLVATEQAVQRVIDLQRKETAELRVEEGKAKTVSHRLQMLEGIQLMIRTKRNQGERVYC